MMQTVRIFYLFIFISCVSLRITAQETWPSPEVQQMYNQARDYLSSGNFPQAIATYQQAIQLAPDKMMLYRDLGKAYYLTANYTEAQKILEPVLKSEEADAQSYQIMAASLAAAGEKKKAKNTLQAGIERFANAGILYHDIGKLYEENNEPVYALESWLDGIQHDPAYHLNYYEAARTYAESDKVVWAILFAETFLNMEHHTQRADETRKLLMDSYGKLFYNIPASEIPKFGEIKKQEEARNFEDAVKQTYMRVSPVVRDGITAETLTMLRTRFLMEWSEKYAARFPYTLFTYQDDMIRSGYFDIYNQWLFGKTANATEYDAWNKFHEGSTKQFENWMGIHPLHPIATDFYNNKKVDDIFSKKKN